MPSEEGLLFIDKFLLMYPFHLEQDDSKQVASYQAERHSLPRRGGLGAGNKSPRGSDSSRPSAISDLACA